MKHTYNISYLFIGGQRHLTGLSFPELVENLNRIQEDEEENRQNLVVTTMEAKPTPNKK